MIVNASDRGDRQVPCLGRLSPFPEVRMIDLYNADTNALLGEITPQDLSVLVEALEEESSEDQDYYITPETIDVIGENGRATDHLLNLLRKALGTSDSVEIRWQNR
jgi:hypothetical protein